MSTKPAKSSSNQVGVFVLNNQAEYPWTCYPFVPNPNGGKKIKTKLKVRFRHIDKDRRNELLEEFKAKLAAAAKAGDNPQTEDDVDTVVKLESFQRMLLNEALTWFECVDPQGNAVEANDDGKAELLKNSWAEDALIFGYTTSLKGRDDSGN